METSTRSVPFKVTRSAEDGDGLTMSGYAAVFNSITRIRGENPRLFDERIMPGAFARTIAAKTPVLMFDHGQHPSIGSVPIGKITELREDARGLYIEARLFDNELVRPVRDAIEGEAIHGMSFRFSVPEGRESWDKTGEVPLRSIHELRCPELGPVVFPAYADTLVGVRAEGTEEPESHEELAAEVDRLTGQLTALAQRNPSWFQMSDGSGNFTINSTEWQWRLNSSSSALTTTATTSVDPAPAEDHETSAEQEPAEPTPDTRDDPALGTSDSDSSEADAAPPDGTPRSLPLEAARLRLLQLRKAS